MRKRAASRMRTVLPAMAPPRTSGTAVVGAAASTSTAPPLERRSDAPPDGKTRKESKDGKEGSRDGSKR